MKILVLLLASFILYECSEVVEKVDILVLTNSTFKEAIAANNQIFVKFYVSWCKHSQALAPEFTEAAKILKNKSSSIKLAMVDVDTQKDLALGQKIQKLPTMKLFRDGDVVEYHGGRKAETIVAWLEKKNGPPTTSLNSIDEANKFIDSQDVVVVGFFKDLDSAAAKNFTGVAKSTEDVSFGVTSNVDIFQQFKVMNDEFIVLFKKFDEGRNEFEGNFTESEIKMFIDKYQLPVVVEFSHETGSKIFNGSIKKHILVFLSKKADNSSTTKSNIEITARKFVGNINFVLINIDVEENIKILEFFNLSKNDIPTFRMINMEEKILRYMPENSEINAVNLEKFAQDVLNGKIKVQLKSQEIPEDWNKNPVKVLVGKNFDAVARNKTQSVFVDFYAPWCGHCKQLEPIWDSLGEAYKDRVDILVAKMDSSSNEVEDIEIKGYPTLKFFPKNSDEIISYEGDRTLKAFQKFLDRNDKEDNKMSGDGKEREANELKNKEEL